MISPSYYKLHQFLLCCSEKAHCNPSVQKRKQDMKGLLDKYKQEKHKRYGALMSSIVTVITCILKTRIPSVFFFLCLHAIHIHHQFTHKSLLAVIQLTFDFSRTADLFPKVGCQNLSTHLSFCQPPQAVGSFLLHQKGTTPSFLHSHTDQEQRGMAKVSSKTDSDKTEATVPPSQIKFQQKD